MLIVSDNAAAARPPCNGSCNELQAAVEGQGSRSRLEPKQSALQSLVMP
jgi:hypothetical protein